MKLNWRRIGGGLRQAGLVFGALMLLVVVGSGCVQLNHGNLLQSLGGVLLLFSISILSGPVPFLLTFFDITDRGLLVWSLVCIPCYWVLLGVAAGLLNADLAPCETNGSGDRRARRIWAIRGTVGVAALLVGLVSYPLGPFGPHHISRGPFWRNRIMNNLRQIDGAKQVLELEGKYSPGDSVSELDLMPHLAGNTNLFARPIIGERYVIGPAGEDPRAVIDSDLRIMRKGWREGYTVPRGEIRLP